MDAAWPDGPLLAGAVSIVMGGSTGIGLAAARCLARHGSVVELTANDEASVTAAVTLLRADAYTARKGAIVAMTRAMAVDYAPEGIRVNSLSPGSVDTPMLRQSAREAGDEDTVIAQWGANHPLGRVGTPKEVADAILFLVSPL